MYMDGCAKGGNVLACVLQVCVLRCSYTCSKSYDNPTVYPNGHCKSSMGQSAWIVVFGGIQLLLIQVGWLEA